MACWNLSDISQAICLWTNRAHRKHIQWREDEEKEEGKEDEEEEEEGEGEVGRGSVNKACGSAESRTEAQERWESEAGKEGGMKMDGGGERQPD